MVTIIAQRRIGFLSGLTQIGQGEGAEEAFHLQLEEAAARATVALTRAKEICVILGPLDMLGLIGSATVVGSLMYGAGICWRQSVELHYQEEEMTDESMVRMLRSSAGPRAHHPPVALAEIVQLDDEVFRVRRLHLIIVDTWRQKWLNRDVISQLFDLPQQHQVRYLFGYAPDGSTYPCYCMHPHRTEDDSFQVVDAATGYIYSLSRTACLKPLEVAHFYDAFSIGHGLDLRQAAKQAFDLPENSINEDLSVATEWATNILPAAGQAYQVPDEEDDNASVVTVASSGAPWKAKEETDSDAAQLSDTNSGAVVDLVTDEDESEAESEEDFELNEKEQRFLHQAYDNFGDYGLPWLQQRGHLPTDSRTPFEDADSVRERFEHLINLPDSWPLMRIMVPLDGLSLQLERIIACVAAELVATHQHPSGQTKFVKRVAKKLTAILACYLAGEVASMLSPVAAIEHREMVAPLYQPLLTPVFWVRPIYTELLHAASRLKKGTRIETARPSNGLVKIMCSPKALGEEPLNATAANRGRHPLDWLGNSCASSICVGPCPLGTLRLLCCEGTRTTI